MTGDDKTSGLNRRRFVTGLATAGAAGLAGCQGGGSNTSETDTTSGGKGTTKSTTTAGSSQNPVTLTVSSWSSYEDSSDEFKSLVTNYDKNHKNVKTEYSGIVSKYKQKLKTQLGAGDAPDLFWLDSSYFSSFADSGVLLDLQPIVDSGYTNDIFDPLMNVFKHEGTQYGIPKDFNTLQLYYNTEMFDKAGLSAAPKSWKELRSSLETINKKLGDDVAPMAVFANARVWWALAYQNGGQILSDDKSEVVLASDANVEALKFLVDLAKDGLAQRPDETGTDWHGQTLGKKKAAVTTMGAWGLGYLGDSFPKVDKKVKIANLPTPSSGEKQTIAYVVSYSAYAKTKSPSAARGLLKHLTSPEAHKAYASGGGVLTPRKSQQDWEYYDKHPRLKTFLTAGEWSNPWNFGPHSAEIINRVNPELEGAMLGKKSPRDALEIAQQKINAEVF